MENIKNIIRKIWEKAIVLSEETKNEWRKDSGGKPIRWGDYRNTHSEFGWVIDIIKPEICGGISNFRPMQWKNELKHLLLQKSNTGRITEIQQNSSANIKHTLYMAAAITLTFVVKHKKIDI